MSILSNPNQKILHSCLIKKKRKLFISSTDLKCAHANDLALPNDLGCPVKELNTFISSMLH